MFVVKVGDPNAALECERNYMDSGWAVIMICVWCMCMQTGATSCVPILLWSIVWHRWCVCVFVLVRTAPADGLEVRNCYIAPSQHCAAIVRHTAANRHLVNEWLSYPSIYIQFVYSRFLFCFVSNLYSLSPCSSIWSWWWTVRLRHVVCQNAVVPYHIIFISIFIKTNQL